MECAVKLVDVLVVTKELLQCCVEAFSVTIGDVRSCEVARVAG